MAQDHDVIIDFTTFFKTIHDFVECDVKNYQTEFFIDIYVGILKEKLLLRKKMIFLSIFLHGKNTSFFVGKI